MTQTTLKRGDRVYFKNEVQDPEIRRTVLREYCEGMVEVRIVSGTRYVGDICTSSCDLVLAQKVGG